MNNKRINKLVNNVTADRVLDAILSYKMVKPFDSVLVGVSGGPDSMALLHILLRLAPRFSLKVGVAHLNHSLRNKDSDNDAEFVRSVVDKLALFCCIEKKDVRRYKKKHKLSIEDAARRVRYDFLIDVAKKNGFNKIATGHNSDDNAELVLMYMMRGSGPLGMAGIPPVRDITEQNIQIIRPLIKVTRSEIVDFLTENGLRYISDKTNEDTKYIRNRIRHHLIPDIKSSYNPRIVETLNRTASIMRAEEGWMDDIINPLFEKSISKKQKNKIFFSAAVLNNMHIAAKRRVIRKAVESIKGDLRRITFYHIDSAISLLEKRAGNWSIDLPGSINIQKHYDSLIIYKKISKQYINGNGGAKAPVFEYRISKPLKEDPFVLFIKELDLHIQFSEISKDSLPDFCSVEDRTGFFDMEILCFPLTVRNLRPGDRFSPLGICGTQKVKKYFINNKISRADRRKTPVVTSKGSIIWLAGYQIDNSVKVTPSTKKVLKAEVVERILHDDYI